MRDKDKGSGGVTLISARGIAPDEGGSSEGGITLLSKRKLDTGLDDDGKAGRLVYSISHTLTLDCFKFWTLRLVSDFVTVLLCKRNNHYYLSLHVFMS